MDELPELYQEGLRLFNREEFFEAHDVLEELWSETKGPERKFLQGLIQASVALFHFGNENYGGAKKLYHSSRNYLAPYGEEYMTLALERFLRDFDRCFTELIECQEAYPTNIMLQEDLVPKFYSSSGSPFD